MRTFLLLMLLASSLVGPAAAQGLPGGVSPSEAMTMYQSLTPQQRQMLSTQTPHSPSSMTPAEAQAWYRSMTPQQKEQAKAWAKQQGLGYADAKRIAKQLLGR